MGDTHLIHQSIHPRKVIIEHKEASILKPMVLLPSSVGIQNLQEFLLRNILRLYLQVQEAVCQGSGHKYRWNLPYADSLQRLGYADFPHFQKYVDSILEKGEKSVFLFLFQIPLCA